MLTYNADSRASAPTAWRLISEPSLWSRWAPHVRGAWALGSPEVEAGRRGLIRLGGAIPVPAAIGDIRPGRSWSWRTGLIELDHIVEPLGTGCRITITLTAPWPLETLLRVSYGPVVGALVKRLARAAENEESDAALTA